MSDTNVTPLSPKIATIAANTVGDQPAEHDSLGFTPYVQAVAAFLTSPETHTPLTMSIEGDWGSGKSSFMLQLEQAIRGPRKKDVFIKNLPVWIGGSDPGGSILRAFWLTLHHRSRITIPFNAWRHDKEDALWAAFALKFTKSLRHQIGLFSGWQGDISLFLGRLKGVRGWLELTFLAISILVLGLGSLGLYRFIETHGTDELTHVISTLTSVEPNEKTTQSIAPDKRQSTGQLPQPYKFLLSHGNWGALLALGIAGLAKFKKHLNLSLSIDLEKYLEKPNYQGRVAFIEDFHQDFQRVLRAYARSKRAYIFIDDLDRCDVPRAADLIQAINLMIGNAGNLVFILGMDREKVAAGITQKYKELIPFISEFASLESLKGQSTASLYFGYSYLEKFIQLSFILPVMAGDDSLRKFLLSIRSQSKQLSWAQRMATYWRTRLGKKKLIGATNTSGGLFSSSSMATAESDKDSVKQEEKIQYLRIQLGGDSDDIYRIVSVVSIIFKHNPRRLKQFINMFRLALFISSRQGLLDIRKDQHRVTLEQLGKFIAMTLRFPDLRTKLKKDCAFLSLLENAALTGRNEESFGLWLNDENVKRVLRYGLNPKKDPFSVELYSLAHFPIDKLLSVLPEIPEVPSKPQNAVSIEDRASETVKLTIPVEQFETLASQYETIRLTQQAGNERTIKMTSLYEDAKRHSALLDSKAVIDIFDFLRKKLNAGPRLMAIAVASVHPRRENLGWLLEVLDDYRSPFEHYECIQAVMKHFEFVDPEICAKIVDILDRHWDDISKDPGRTPAAGILRDSALAQSKIVAPKGSADVLAK